MKVAIYVRVSTDKQEEKNQEYQLKEFAQKNSWEIYDIYKDIISGKEEKRPEFERLFQDARKMHFDIVLFWDISRFSRAGTHHTLQKLKELENKGIQWHSYSDPYLSSLGDFKDVVISILSTLAKIEREKISDRTKAGIERAKKQGKKVGKPKKRLTQNQYNEIMKEYEKQGSISRTAKIFKGRYSYGFLYKVIKEEN